MEFHLGLQDLTQHAVDVGRGTRRFNSALCGGIDIRHGVVQRRGSIGWRLGRRRGGARQRNVERFFACTHAIGDGLHRLQVDADPLAIAQCRVQLRQCRVCVIDHRQYRRRGGTGAIEHAVEQALDLPRELTQGTCADQAATALQCVENAADRPQPVHVVRLHAPCRQQRAEIAQLVVEFFQEHLADVLVDVLGIVVETRIEPALGHDRRHGFGRHDGGRHGLGIEAGGSGIQLCEELRIGFAEVDRRDGIHIDQCHGRRRRHCRQVFGCGQINGRCDVDCGIDRGVAVNGGVEPFGDGQAIVGLRHRTCVNELQRRRRGLLVVQRQRFHCLQRQHVIGVVQQAAVETEHHIVAQRRVAVLLGGNRIEGRRNDHVQRRGRRRLVQRRRQEGVIIAVYGACLRVALFRHRRFGQRPGNSVGLFGGDGIETDRIEAVERRRTLVAAFGSTTCRRVESTQFPLRHFRRGGAGGSEQQGRRGAVRFGRQRWRTQRSEHQAVVGGRSLRQRVEGEIGQRRRHVTRCRRGGLHVDIQRFDLQRLGWHDHSFAHDRLHVFGSDHAALGQRPVAQRFQAAAGDVEDVLATRTAVTQGFQVVLQAGHGVGQGVQLATTGHPLTTDQFGFDVLLHATQIVCRGAQVEHAQCAGDIAEQAWHVLQFGVVPAGFDESDEMLAGGGEIGDRLVRQHFHRAPVLHRARIILATATGTEVCDLVIQRCIDIEQRTGDIQQHVFVDLLAALDNPAQRVALLHDHAPRSAQAEHAQRIGHRTQLGHLLLQLLRRTVGTQVQVQRVLDLQQFFLDRVANGVQQLAVAAAEAAACMVQFRFGGGHRIGREREQHAVVDQRFATGGADLVEQRLQHDRDVTVSVLQALQVIGQQHAAAHQGGTGLVALGDLALADGDGELFQFLGHHRRCIQFDHAQRALHLVQVAGADAHAAAVGRIFGEVLDLVAHQAQGLVQLGLDPAQGCVAHRIAQAAHGCAPVAAARRSRGSWRGEWKCFIDWFLARRPARVTPAA